MPYKPLKRLNNEHKHIGQLLAGGVPPIKIAELTGRSLGAIRALANDTMIKQYVASLQVGKEQAVVDSLRNAIDRLSENAGKVVDVMLDLALNNEYEPSIRRQAAKDIITALKDKVDIATPNVPVLEFMNVGDSNAEIDERDNDLFEQNDLRLMVGGDG